MQRGRFVRRGWGRGGGGFKPARQWTSVSLTQVVTTLDTVSVPLLKSTQTAVTTPEVRDQAPDVTILRVVGHVIISGTSTGPARMGTRIADQQELAVPPTGLGLTQEWSWLRVVPYGPPAGAGFSPYPRSLDEYEVDVRVSRKLVQDQELRLELQNGTLADLAFLVELRVLWQWSRRR